MDKIGGIATTVYNRPRKKKKEDRSQKGKLLPRVFGDVLNETSQRMEQGDRIKKTVFLSEKNHEETIGDLLDRVHENGEALKKNPVFGPLNAYKKAVGDFIRHVVNHGLELADTVGIRNPKTMQQKKYVILRVIDERLESLAAHILRNQTDQLYILQRINEINGLLVDLTG